MANEPSHRDCLELLANPSTQNMLETLGYEYSASGRSEYRKARRDVVPMLIGAIVTELALHPIFPLRCRDNLPQIGVHIHKRGNDFVLMDIDKPSVWVE